MSFTSDKKELRRILNSHKIGECTTEEETAFISVFFRLYHPDWYNKTQGLMQVVTYKIKAETDHQAVGRCFWLILENGVEDDIGFNKLNAHPADKEQYMRQNIAAACRTAVKQPSIKPFRDSILKKFKEDLPVYSDLSGKPILDKGDFHIDHYELTFEDLVEKWIEIKGMEYLYQKINMNDHMSTITKFVDENLVEEFVQYHDQHTHLRVVTKEENLSLLKKKEKHRKEWVGVGNKHRHFLFYLFAITSIPSFSISLSRKGLRC